MVKSCVELKAAADAYSALALAASAAAPAPPRTLTLDCAGDFRCVDESLPFGQRDLVINVTGHGSLTLQVGRVVGCATTPVRGPDAWERG